jgi:hypothetical protein
MNFLSTIFPIEIIDQILIYCDREDILAWGEESVSDYIWLRKRDKTIKDACKNKNLIGIKYLVGYGDADWVCDALDMSAKYNYIEGIIWAIQFYKESFYEHIPKKYLNTAMVYAAAYGHLDLVRYFLARGSSIETLYMLELDRTYFDLNSTMHYLGHFEFIDSLSIEGLDIFEGDNYKLICAVKNNNLKEIKYLIEYKGVDVHIS